jgi:hypothetical protein
MVAGKDVAPGFFAHLLAVFTEAACVLVVEVLLVAVERKFGFP